MAKSRASRLMENCPELDAIVIANGGEPFLDSTFWYLTEQMSGCFEGTFAIVSKDGTLDVITSTLEAETAGKGRGNVHVYKDRESRNAILKEVLEGAVNVGFNVQAVPYAYVDYVKKTAKIKVKDATAAIEKTVSVKDRKEIEFTREACRISSIAAGKIPEILRAGITEKEAAAELDGIMRDSGGMGNAFESIVAFGENSSQPHYSPGDRRLRMGDVALFDFGTKYNRYCSDMTRTVFFGKPHAKLEKAYHIVKEAQQAGFEIYRDGAKACDADLAARKIIDASEFKDLFIHSFGHGIGMNVHEAISVSQKSQQVLSAGNVVSAEPGIYIPGIGGIRIEDTCLVKKDGAERLTSFDRELTILK